MSKISFILVILYGLLISNSSAKAETADAIQVQLPNSFSSRLQDRYLQRLQALATVKLNGDSCQSKLCLRFESHSFENSEAYKIDVQKSTTQTQVIVKAEGRGLVYGAYDVLEQLGYRFWHPFEAYIPLNLDTSQLKTTSQSPALKARGIAHHTMHPLELSHVLNGWGPGGPDDAQGFKHSLEEYEDFLEWLIANRQNKFEWVLLEKADWQSFSRSTERQKRLRKLSQLAHHWQLNIGIDAPLALQQQNGWRLIREAGSPEAALREMEASLDWLAGTGIDFVTTEMGLSEFHNSGAQGMLNWLNHASNYLDKKYKLPFYTKIHISSGQFTQEYKDPETGQALNFNYLPYYGNSLVGIMPHTVQIYSLDDPAPTYGHTTFNDMRRFMGLNSGKRQMMWYPETSYWVNYDINVPLFLPVYAQRRVHDLRLLKQDQLELEGQIIFSSGFEWGYWLNDVLTGRAAWTTDANSLQVSEKEAFHTLLSHTLMPYGEAKEALIALFEDSIEQQHQLLVLGEVQGQRPVDIRKNNGMAYLAGQDTWSQMAEIIERFGLTGFETQPKRYSLESIQNDPEQTQKFLSHAYPLLVEMERSFVTLAQRADTLKTEVPQNLQSHFAEFHDGLWLNAYRAKSVRSLYEAALQRQLHNQAGTDRWLKRSHDAISAAQRIVIQRRKDYRSDPERLDGWYQNPTAYNYGYLFQARELFFWKREWLQFAYNNYHPCYKNIIDPLRVGIPDPDHDWRAQWARGIFPLFGLGDCTAPKFPRWRDWKTTPPGVTPTTDIQ